MTREIIPPVTTADVEVETVRVADFLKVAQRFSAGITIN